MPLRPASRRWDAPSHCGGSRAAAAVADTVFLPLEPEATVVARLRQAFEQSPQAKRFVIHDEWHPPIEEIISAAAGVPVCVYGRPVTDTCKEVASGLVQRTVPRESLFIAAGPWIFTRDALDDALPRVAGREQAIPGLLDLCRQARLRVRTLARA